ncbi:MAG: hypothetical protein ACHQ1H_14850, partial [Nitrososphaerales archaeon]
MTDPTDSPLSRFQLSMIMDYEKWHDGIGYDLEVLKELSAGERRVIEETLINKKPLDWRDVEALAVLDTPFARKTLKAAASGSDPEVRMAVVRYAPSMITNAERTASILKALKKAKLFGGLSQALDEIEEFHPPEIIAELFHGALRREGEVAVLFAAMLFFVYGKTSVAFDMEQRPFFLRFNTADSGERQKVFDELCNILG